MDSLPGVVKSFPVRIVPSFEHPVLAWSTASMFETYVSYNPHLAEKAPPAVLAFALVHEYAHLQLGHVEAFQIGERPVDTIRQQELDADGFAARFWAANDPEVAQAAAASFLSPEAGWSMSSETPARETGYPTRSERAQVILDCLAETQERSAAKDL